MLIPDATIEKQFDLVFSNQGGEWNDFARNWTLAKASVKRLVDELNLKVTSAHVHHQHRYKLDTICYWQKVLSLLDSLAPSKERP